MSIAALGGAVLRPVTFAWLDVLGDALRATTAGFTIAVPPGTTGDAEFDGQTFDGIDARLVEIGPVSHAAGGSDTLTLSLSGLIAVDAELLNLMADRANWQGRVARLWHGLLSDAGALTAVWPYYTGYMMVPRLRGDADGQTIELSIENYLALLSEPSGRSYLDQAEFDPGDRSAGAAIAVANGRQMGMASARGGGGRGRGGGATHESLRPRVSSR